MSDYNFQGIAKLKATADNTTIYVVAKDGSYLYLTFNDDFAWDDVVFVAKPLNCS